MWWLIAGLTLISLIGIVFILRYVRMKNSIRKMAMQLEEIQKEPENNRILFLDFFQRDLERLCKTTNDYIKTNQKMRIIQQNKEKKLRMQIESISHDLRTPLTAMLGYLSFVNKEQLEEETKEALEVVERKGKNLQSLICNFYDLSRLEMDEYFLSVEKINISRFLKENILSSFQQLEESGLQVKINIEETDCFLMVDVNAMERIFQNMIQNAIRYGETYFCIGIKKREDKICILFENDTYSLKEEDLSHIFERFYMKEESRTKEGTGLGLTIGKLLAEAMGAKVEARLEGNKFTIAYEFPFK